ncbi:MAG TPA: hypothetical protein DCQ37_18785 [Desulfobacteraceae bacterium]|nr:hypothetical protein [Desulfobacteraceae bacterium]
MRFLSYCSFSDKRLLCVQRLKVVIKKWLTLIILMEMGKRLKESRNFVRDFFIQRHPDAESSL